MQVAVHLGAHVTDGERLIKSLAQDQGRLSDRGVLVPPAGTYRKALREAVQAYVGGQTLEGAGQSFLDQIPHSDAAGRVVLSNPAFLSTASRAFEGGQLYSLTETKIAALVQLFGASHLELFLATRNPATFVPALWAQSKAPNVAAFLNGLPAEEIRWSELVSRIRAEAPDVALTVWANEDTPLIWGPILRRLAGVGPDEAMTGEHDLLATIMSDEGMARFRDYLGNHPPEDEGQMSRVVAAFLGKFAVEEEIEEEVEAPGWSADLVEALTDAYEVDLARIAAIDGVTVLTP